MATRSRKPKAAKAPRKAAKAPAKARDSAVAPLANPEPTPAQAKASEIAKAQSDKEVLKAQGQTKSQQEIAEYHRGDFQTTDPVTGKPRKRMGGNWQKEEEPPEEDEDDE